MNPEGFQQPAWLLSLGRRLNLQSQMQHLLCLAQRFFIDAYTA